MVISAVLVGIRLKAHIQGKPKYFRKGETTMEEEFYSVYDLIATHRNRWLAKEQEEKENGDYHSAQSYKDMAYAASVLIIELNRYRLLDF